MRRIYLIFISLCLVSNLFADISLPGNNFFPGWVKSDSLRHFPKEDLFNHINGGAELFQEFGFIDLFVQSYQNGENEIVLEAYQMESPEAALGIYLMKCGKETPIEGITARNSGSKYQVISVKGNYFIQINSFSGDETLMPALVTLAQGTLVNIPQGREVQLLKNLPEENLIPGSELIIRGMYGLQPIYTFGDGDILRLKGKTFGVVGNYLGSNDSEYTKLIFLYSDNSSAKFAFENLVTNLDPYLKILEQHPTGLIFEDFQNKFGRAKLSENQIRINIHLTEIPEE